MNTLLAGKTIRSQLPYDLIAEANASIDQVQRFSI